MFKARDFVLVGENDLQFFCKYSAMVCTRYTGAGDNNNNNKLIYKAP